MAAGTLALHVRVPLLLTAVGRASTIADIHEPAGASPVSAHGMDRMRAANAKVRRERMRALPGRGRAARSAARDIDLVPDHPWCGLRQGGPAEVVHHARPSDRIRTSAVDGRGG